jgi:hypothetical protein
MQLESGAPLGEQFGVNAATSPDDQAAVAGETSVAVVRPGTRVHLSHAGRTAALDLLHEPELSSAEMPGPRLADLAGDFLPFDRAALERAVDRFLDQFDGIASELARLETSTGMLTTMSIVGIGALASGIIIQQHRRRSQLARGVSMPAEEDEFLYFTGLPRSWSWSIAKA